MKVRAIRPITAAAQRLIGSRVFAIAGAAATVLLLVASVRAQPVSLASWSSARGPVARTSTDATSRIVRRFDFEEPNYYDTIPRGWMRFPDADAPDPAFPKYTEGRLDHTFGHDGAPSFYLASTGRSVAYRYVGGEARVRMGEYLVTGWVHADHLENARASLSAYYLDWEGEPIAGSQRFSRLIGSSGTGADDEWQYVEVRLPSTPPGAHFVGITCWVVQDNVYLADATAHRHINLRDVGGGAWFDDITVQGLPRGGLTTDHPGNIASAAQPVRLLANVADNEIAGLSSEAIIRDHYGSVIARRVVTVHTFEEAKDEVVALTGLPAGLYEAQLIVRSLADQVLERRVKFAVLADAHRLHGNESFERMGIALPSAPACPPEDTVAFVSNLGVGSLKLPLWTNTLAEPAFDDRLHDLHDLLDELLVNHMDVIGVFSGPPTAMLRASGDYPPTLLDVLAQDPRGWRNDIDSIVAPYANIFHAWQLGDEYSNLAENDVTERAVLALRNSISELLPDPHLAVAINAGDVPSEHTLPIRTLSLTVPPDVLPQHIEDHVAPHEASGYSRLWVTVPPVDAQYAEQDAALGEWALRLIAARWTNASRVFTAAPWTQRRTATDIVVEPTAAYLVLRTVIDMLGDATPVAEFELGSTARVQAFGDGHNTTLIAWDPYAPLEGTPITLQVGAADHAVDMWGHNVELPALPDGQRRLTLTQEPLYVPGVEQWLAEFQAAIHLAPRMAAFSIEPQRHLLNISNPNSKPISGEITFSGDEGWEIDPRTARFGLLSGDATSIPLFIRVPQNESAGTKMIKAAVQFTSEPKYRLEIPLPLDLGLSDVDVWGYALNEGDTVVIHHGVTNRSDQSLSFRTFAMVPGRSRQYRVINELLPGQTLDIEYVFRDVSDAAGQYARLGLREVNGPRRHNLETQIP